MIRTQMGFKNLVLILVSVLFFSQAVSFAEETKNIPTPKKWSFESAGLIPVQSGGRVKPLDSVAREFVLFITGSRTLGKWEPMDLVFSWISHPEYWENQDLIRIAHKDLLKQLLLDPTRSRFSAKELLTNVTLAQYAEGVTSQRPGAPPAQVVKSINSQPNPREQELKRVLDRISLFRSVASGASLTIVPGEPGAPWKSVVDGNPLQHPVRAAFLDMMKAYYQNSPQDFETQSKKTADLIEAQAPGWNAKQTRLLEVEAVYNQSRPFRTAYALYLIAALFWMGSILFASSNAADASPTRDRIFAMGGWFALISALFSHVVGFALRIYVSGRPPVSNMYESIVWVAFGAVVFSLIIYWMHRQTVLLAVGSWMGAFTLIAADSAPAVMDPGIHNLVPVLRSNLWLTIHVLTITLGYAAFALSLGISDTALFHYLKGALGRSPAGVVNTQTHRLNQLSYRAIQFGVVLLAAGTILGGVWADYSWGRFWGWDPKETWALIALLTYLAILHGRFAGWVTSFGFASMTVVCFLSVVMAWYGVNFVLGVGLHSYGFSSGGTGWVLGFCVLQLIYVVGIAFLRKSVEPKTVA